jgi:hydrogenase maturation protease
MSDFWNEQAKRGPHSAVVGGATVRRGTLVRLNPRAGGDIFDLALAGRLAVVESIEQDSDGKMHVTVTVEDDPGRDLGEMRALAHRFFFGVDEIEPVEADVSQRRKHAATLVAGIGNVFLGDDGFGVEVATRLQDAPLPEGVDVREFGIRGMDLAYALQEEYTTVVFVDAAARGEEPGTVSLVEPELDLEEVTLDTHGMDPLRVLGLARAMGRIPERVLVVACEPQRVTYGEHDDDLVGELSAPVAAAVPQAVELILSLVTKLNAESNERVVPK